MNRNCVRRFFCLFLWAALSSSAGASAASGQTLYEEGRFEEALEQFILEQVERPNDVKTLINIGTTLYRLKRFKEAASSFERAAETKDTKLKQHALYDLGNSQFREQAFEEAVKSFEQALAADPNDVDARENLAAAKAALEQQPKDDKKNKGDKDDKKDESQKDQDKQENNQDAEKDKKSERSDSQDEAKKENAKKEGQDTPQQDDGDDGQKKVGQDEHAQNAEDAKKAPDPEKSAASDKTENKASQNSGASTTMSRERAQQLLDKLGETKTVRPESQKTRPPAGEKSW